MPVAAISDIHSNLPALQAVLADIEARGINEIWCLGDVLGYGADPDECAELISERCRPCLVGNHDLAVLGALDIGSFSEAAAEAVVWTRENASERTLDFLRELEPIGLRRGIALFHASPRDPVWEYVLSLEQAHACLEAQPERITLIGHSHVSLFFALPEGGSFADTVGGQAGDGSRLELADGGRWLINPGSVGQPRDGDPRAAWLELDPEGQAAVFHRCAYDIDRAAAAIAAHPELPKRLADRLYVGQ
ncbi:MAG: metallophosphoesterase family protein [Solirubrobacterales bacterium]